MTSGLAAAKLTVFAAASLASVFPQVDKAPRYSFAGSDQLAFQIVQGAPADVFAAANTKYPDKLYARGLAHKPRVFATNELVLIVPRENDARIRSVYDLRRSGVRVLIGGRGVPVGDYARQALAKLRLSSVLARVVSNETDVKAVVAKVALGEADAGFVYRTDARAAAGAVGTIRLPAKAQPRIAYEIAVVKATRRLSAARAFVARVLSPRGRAALRRAGFGVP